MLLNVYEGGIRFDREHKQYVNEKLCLDKDHWRWKERSLGITTNLLLRCLSVTAIIEISKMPLKVFFNAGCPTDLSKQEIWTLFFQ